MASESIGAIYPTEIPGYADNADIQAAFRLYHYGSTAYNTANSNTAELVNPSIAYTLNNLQTQITTLVSPREKSSNISKRHCYLHNYSYSRKTTSCWNIICL